VVVGQRWCNGETFTNFFLSVFLLSPCNPTIDTKVSTQLLQKLHKLQNLCKNVRKNFIVAAYFNKINKKFLLKFSLKKFLLSLWWWANGDVMGKHSQTFFSQSFFSLLCNLLPYTGFSQSTPPKTTKTYEKMVCPLIHSLWHTSKIKFKKPP
jgi:hypothetical protein